MQKVIHVFGGGTVEHITNHLALSAPAYGATARTLAELCREVFPQMETRLHLTKMAGGNAETSRDVSSELAAVVADPLTKVIFFNTTILDYRPQMLNVTNSDGDDYCIHDNGFGKYVNRLETRSNPSASLRIRAKSTKLVASIRENRKDIFLVAFKTTCGATETEMFRKGLRLCKEASVNLVLVNDTSTRMNMIVTPEEAAYHVTPDRLDALRQLVDMAYYRSHLTFTQSTVIAGDRVPWSDDRVPASLRGVIDYCIKEGAYKEFNGGTVGHFAVKLSDTEFLTSIRRSNFNDLDKVGLVYVKTDGPDTVIAYGAKPSVGGQSQRIVFRDHPGYDCIAHFHCPLRADHADDVPVKSQREVECGSHQCGKQTSSGLKQFGNLKAVMLDNHGPNIVFNRNIDPREVIEFIERNFTLAEKTGGYTI